MIHHLPQTEKANALTHAFGLIFGLAVLPMLISSSGGTQLGINVFAFSFLFMYTASTTYHLMTVDISKRRWQRVDHISIYFLIAGTYTPFILNYLDSQKGLLFLQLLWGFVAVGSIFKIFYAGRFKFASTMIYIAMGSAVIFVLNDFMKTMPMIILIWLGIGGAFYTLGTIFYLWKKLTYHHAIWHLFVLGGSISHWYAVLLSIAPSV